MVPLRREGGLRPQNARLSTRKREDLVDNSVFEEEGILKNKKRPQLLRLEYHQLDHYGRH